MQAVMAKSPDRWLRAAAAQGLSLRDAAVFASPGKSARPHYHPSPPAVDRQPAGQQPQQQRISTAAAVAAAMATPGGNIFDCFAAGEAGVEPYSARLHTAERSGPGASAAAAAALAAAAPPVSAPPAAHHAAPSVGPLSGGAGSELDFDLAAAAGSSEYMEVRAGWAAGRRARRGRAQPPGSQGDVQRTQADVWHALPPTSCLSALSCSLPVLAPGLQMLRRLEQGLKVDRQQLEPFTHPAPPPLPENWLVAAAADAQAGAAWHEQQADGAVTVRARQASATTSSCSGGCEGRFGALAVHAVLGTPPGRMLAGVSPAPENYADAGGGGGKQQAGQQQDCRVQPAGSA